VITRIIVAHRPETIRSADRIVVLVAEERVKEYASPLQADIALD
jgi:ABC-type multidrug transport system fused ATPase/permease subunit